MVAPRFAAFLVVAVAATLGPGIGAPARAAVPAGARAEDGVVVKLRDGASASAQSLGGRSSNGLGRGRSLVRLDRGARLDEVLGQLKRDPRVEWAEPNLRYRAAVVPNDPCLSPEKCEPHQWGPAQVQAPAAWDVTKGSSAIRVAVIDGGVDAGHPDLMGKVDFGGDYTGDPADDCDFHGTHVAGTIGAETNNNKGVAGVGWNTRVVDYRVLSWDDIEDDCTGTLSRIAQAIDQAVRDGVKVVNLSLAGPFPSRTILASVSAAVSAGVVVVAAAGNEGQEGNPVQYPAAYPDVVSVAASTESDQTAEKSERGQWIDLVAPGEDIVSTVPGNSYASFDGTSMATPHVAAAAALLFAHNPGLSARGVIERIQIYSDPYAGTGADVRYGRLNIYRALTGSGVGSFGEPGYWMVATDGGIFSFGGNGFYGSTGSMVLNQPVFAMAATPSRQGYWFVARDGGIFAFGDAVPKFFGSRGGKPLPYGPIVGMAATPTGNGYWLASSGGDVYYFGDAKPHGTVAPFAPSAPIVGMAASATGKGYWLVGSDGAVYAFGDAQNYGDMSGFRLNKPVVGMAPTITGQGYWLVATDGGIFSFGDAQFRGSTGSIALNKPIVGMKRARDGDGYWLVASDGGVFAYNAGFYGSMGGTPLNQPVVGIG